MNATIDLKHTVTTLSTMLLDLAHDEWEGFINSDGDIYISEDDAFEKVFYAALGDFAPDDLYTKLIHSPEIEEAFKEMHVIVKDRAEDQFYRDYEPYDPVRRMKEVGLGWNDFV